MVETTTADAIAAAVDASFDEQVAFTQELVRRPSLRGQEATAQDFLARELAQRGFSVDRWQIDIDDIKDMPGFSPKADGYEDAYLTVGSLRCASPQGRSLAINGHIDVVPEGPHDMWATPPFDPVIRDGWMHGRGAGDMKSGWVCGLFALEALKRAGFRPAADVTIEAVIEEESTGNGALACRQRGYFAEAALIPEPMGTGMMRSQVGVMWFHCIVRGHPVHVAYAGAGANAIEAAYRLIGELHTLEAAWNGRGHERYAHMDHPLNFNVGKIEGGDWASSVPAWCRFDMRVGVFPGQDLATARAEVENCVAEAARNDNFLANSPPEIVWDGFQAEGYVLEEGTEVESVLRSSHQAVFGTEMAERALTGTTDARFFGLYANMPALVYGPTAENIHGFDERVNLESCRQVTKAMALFIADWCGIQAVG
ncbi:MAG: ArgE/DapE family deacylase [Alphaproteobacteria bacterium]|nr:ArgE/DapE family deacylase [Rhodospirillaceae bacterium]MBT7648772.1 ArgE/DapE family deacylase [Rhodospirillaceae bacterium]MDG2483066.1 ArgE/DapE family deacylase [Alphaproteobacteria bacterium]